jgi:hypothetical protein
MKNILFFVAGGVAVALILGLVGFAYAQTQPPGGQNPGFTGGGMDRFGGHGYSMMAGWQGQTDSDFEGPMHDYMVIAFAEALDMTPEALESELDAGKTLWQVAEEKNINLEDFRNLMLEARGKALESAVTAGVITQQQADWMTQRINQMQANGYGPDYAPCGGIGGGNWRGGPAGRWNAQSTPTP